MSRKSRTSYSNVSKAKDGQNNFYIAEYESVKIHCAQFYGEMLLICSDFIHLYNIQEMTKIVTIQEQSFYAAFVPFSRYLVYIQQKDRESRELVVYNYRTKTKSARMVVNFIIENIKCSRRTVVLSSLEHIYALHFPTLKPIYQGFAGNGINVIYDVSVQGFTLTHSTHKKGEAIIRNFTNIQTNKLLANIETQSREESKSRYYRPSATNKTNRKSQFEDETSQIQKQIKILASQDNLSLMRLSPNGYRVVVSSLKGNIVRMFSCLTGQCMTEYRMSDIASPIVDMQFIREGNDLVCLNENSQVTLFFTKMLDLELMSQSARKGYQIYEQKNPKSFFSFLGFINSRFKDEFPFAYFMLDTKTMEINEEKNKIEAEDHEKEKEKKSIPEQISEVVGEQELELEEAVNIIVSGLIKEQKYQKINKSTYEGLKMEDVMKISQIEESEKGQLSVAADRSRSGSNNNIKFKQFKPHSMSRDRQASIKSATRLGKKMTELKMFGQKSKVLDFRGIINFNTTTNINVFQNKYIFKLKYDPFNGGQMVQKTNINLLKDPLFTDL